MRIRHILALGLVVNCGLIAGVVWQSTLERTRSLPMISEPSAPVVDELSGEFVVPVPPGMGKVVIERPFLWADVETEDYLELIENLRNAGCPESTVRDIVLARAADDFAARRWELLEPIQTEFWDRLARGQTLRDWELPDAIETRFDEVRKEGEAVLAGLREELGVEEAVSDDGESAYWSFLTPEKLDEVLQVSAHFKSLIDQVDEPDAEGRRVAVRELVTERDEALRLLVGEEQWREYGLRRGAAARWLRGTSGLALNEEEMRALTAAWQTNGIDPRRLTLEERRDALAAVVGSERAGDSMRRADGDFGQFQKVARRHGLPPDVADRAIRVKEAATREAAAILGRAYGSEEVRARAAVALLAGVQAELAGIYGEQAWPTLQKYGLGWMDGLFPTEDAGQR